MYYNVLITIRMADGTTEDYPSRQRATDATNAKWAALSRWAKKRENQAKNLTQITMTAVKETQ